MQTKYIFVTGGVCSGLGKGITAASLGRLLKARGYKVTMQKFDPYINVDPGNMNPLQHGEVFVTDDGAETDLDLGHYERFIDENLTQYSSVTTGKIYWSILNKERKGEFAGATVQVIPHVTNAIKERAYRVGKSNQSEVVITEIGGTVGDIESLPFLEAIRQIASEVGKENVIYIHVTLIPYLGKSGEIKTKPSQHSVKELRSIGIQPDILVCRTELELPRDTRDKMALFCNVDKESVIQNLDAGSLYEVPLMLENEGLANVVCKKLGLANNEPDLTEWINIINREKGINKQVKIALVGKYTALHDAYISIVEAIKHAGIYHEVDVDIKWINCDDVTEDNVNSLLADVKGLIIPSGFGEKNVEGQIISARYARENKMPLFGIGMGMHCAVIEYARNVIGLKGANSTELDADTPYPVVDLMPEQKDIDSTNGTIRVGAYPCKLTNGTKVFEAYGEDVIYERHHNSYEINNEYREELIKHGLILSGMSPDDHLVETVELKDHPWYVGVSFRPEYKSRPNRTHPLFRDFIKAVIE